MPFVKCLLSYIVESSLSSSLSSFGVSIWYSFWYISHTYFLFVHPSLVHPVVILVCLYWVGSYLYSSLQSPHVADIELRIKHINILYQKQYHWVFCTPLQAQSMSHSSQQSGKPMTEGKDANPDLDGRRQIAEKSAESNQSNQRSIETAWQLFSI